MGYGHAIAGDSSGPLLVKVVNLESSNIQTYACYILSNNILSLSSRVLTKL